MAHQKPAGAIVIAAAIAAVIGGCAQGQTTGAVVTNFDPDSTAARYPRQRRA